MNIYQSIVCRHSFCTNCIRYFFVSPDEVDGEQRFWDSWM
ncbi:MAG TPA: hypothetical protein IAA30_02800 [Candidatus Treponema faecavium]|nr:hypothetical protein [Candidatus Treponema faecavium]